MVPKLSRAEAAEELLVVMRSLGEDGTAKHDYYLSTARPQTSPDELARVAKAEHHIEECSQRAKGEAGLAGPAVVSGLCLRAHRSDSGGVLPDV